jgi:peptidoglycan-associated lipoprotein
MRSKALSLSLTAAMALAVAACSPKQADLPPPPPPATPAPAPAPTPTPTPPVTSSIIPGSLADFINQAGSDRVRFGFDRYDLDSTASDILSRQARWLNQWPNTRITIEGHTDERGTREYNLALGERRATAVKNYLAAQGVSTSRIGTISYGKERPEADGADEESHAINRRAVTTLGN